MASKPPRRKKSSLAKGAAFKNPLLKKGEGGAVAATAANEQPLEEQVQIYLKLKAETMPAAPAVLSAFFEEVAPKFRLGESSWGIFEAFVKRDIDAGKFAKIFAKDEYCVKQFMSWFESFGHREEVSGVEGAVVLLGLQNSRNFILALQMLRVVHGQLGARGSDGQPSFRPEEVLRYAIKTEEPLVDAKVLYADLAFAAGAIFDLLALVAARRGVEGKRILLYIDKVFSNGLRAALIAKELAVELPGFSLHDDLFSACLLHDVGKIALALLNPDYLDFVERTEKDPDLSDALRLFAEERQFEMNHAQLGRLCCEIVPLFLKIAKVVSFHHEPYLIQEESGGLGQLALLVCLSSNMANHFYFNGQQDDPVVWKWKTMALRDCKIPPAALLRVAARLEKKL